MATHVTHVEVVGKNAAKLQKIYSEAFGWALDTNTPEGYGMRQEESGISAGCRYTPRSRTSSNALLRMRLLMFQ